MIKLIITNGSDVLRFNPNRQYFDIYDYLKNELGWDHVDADKAASWAETAAGGSVYNTGNPNLRIYTV